MTGGPSQPEAENGRSPVNYLGDQDEVALIEELRSIMQDAHINFLVGAGASAPGFSCLGDIESRLQAVEESRACAKEEVVERVRASIVARFCDFVLLPNKQLLSMGQRAEGHLAATRDSYQQFVEAIHRLLLRRRSTLLTKHANVFTSNVDVALELAAEASKVNLNDGFRGRFAPAYDSRAFGTVQSMRSLQYDNLSEIPTISLVKLHGSVDWRVVSEGGTQAKEQIVMDSGLTLLEETQQRLEQTRPHLFDLSKPLDLKDLYGRDPLKSEHLDLVREFLKSYNRLQIVNPSKAKFQTTVLNHTYYDLMRLLANSLEKENSVLLIVGFSFRDEHILEILERAAGTNPTLQIFVFGHTAEEAKKIEGRLSDRRSKNDNIRVLSPFPEVKGVFPGEWTLREVSIRLLNRIVPPGVQSDTATDAAETQGEPAHGASS